MTPSCSKISGPATHCELIWEADRHCTVQAGEVALASGEPAAWTPELLVAAGIAASMMTAFVRLAAAAGLTVLAYASQQRVERSADSEESQIVIAPCVTVRNGTDAVLARALCDHAVAESRMAALLSRRLRIEPHIVTLPDEAIDGEC